MTLAESVVQEIELLVASGFENRESLYLRILETTGEELDLPDEVTSLEDIPPAIELPLRDAIEDAFTRKEEEIRSWPATTDCDRLRKAFDTLNEQGIVALENCGVTVHEGGHRADLVALARDEARDNKTHGFCYYHEQDMMNAIEGHGLWLAFGAYKEETKESVPASPPPVCPSCNGRGWIQTDPREFPKQCPNHVAPQAPRPGPAQRVAASIVQACRELGLNVEWDGSPDTRIRISPFRWMRRLSHTSESDIGEFLASWELEIRAGYKSVDEVLSLLDERARDWFASFADFGPTLLGRLRDHAKRFLEEERAREATWSEATVNDRVTAAFEELRQRRIFASECSGLTIQDGWGYAGLGASPDHRGVVFFHRGDVIDGVNGHGFFLAYGVLPVADSSDAKAAITLAREIMSVLEGHGVPCTWGNSARERIRIAPFQWRRRRWTKAPAYERRQAKIAKSPSFWSRVFGSSSGAPPGPSGAASSARQFAEVVRAARDEGHFDLRRAKRMQAAWKSLGNDGDAHVGDIGLPLVFVRAEEYTTVMPVPAAENLCEEKDEIFLRAARIKKERSSGSG